MNFKLQRESFRSKKISAKEATQEAIVKAKKDKLNIFINQFENSVDSITLVDIPNQEGSISKEEFKKKLNNKNIHTAGSIEESLLMNNKDKNCIFLCAGSLYLAGEVLNLN